MMAKMIHGMSIRLVMNVLIETKKLDYTKEVMLVLVFHFDLFSIGKAGFIGVDVFFVISGFLITYIIKHELDSDSFSLKTFYLRRIRRLAPALCIT